MGVREGVTEFQRMTSNAPPPAEPGLADEWFTARRFALLLAVLICASFPDVVSGRGTFFHRDFSLFGYPLAFFHRECFWRGEWPLWNPLNYCGLPFLAQWNTLTLYPLSLLYLLLPLAWSLGVFCLGHFYLAGLGMYFLALRWTENRFAAAIAGLAFTFNALMLNFLMWPNDIAAMGWLPWVVLAVQRAWREGGRRVLTAAMVGTMQMLSGAPEVILFTWVFLGALWLGEFAQGHLAFRGPRVARFGRLAAVVLLISGLSAAQLLPFLDLLAHSQRDAAYNSSQWPMPPWGWANFFVPLFRALPTPAGVYAQPAQYWVFSYYLGVGTATMALLAMWRSRRLRKPATLLAMLTVLCLILALGERGYLYTVLCQGLPGLGFMRYPVKFVILPVFLMPLLAALFVENCLATPQALWPKQRRRMAIGLVAVLAVIGFLIWAAFQFPLRQVAPSVAALSGASRAVFVILILGALIAACQVQKPRLKSLLQFGVLLLLWLDVMTMGPRPNPTAPQWVYEPRLAQRVGDMQPVPRVGSARVLVSTEAEVGLSFVTQTNAVNQVLFSRVALQGDANLLDDIPVVAGFFSLHLREVRDVLGVLYKTPEPPAGLMDFLAISHLNAPGKITERNFRPSHLPWVTGGQKPVFANATETLQALEQSDFDPRTTVYLPPESRTLVTVSNASAPKILVREFAPQRLRIEVEASEPALVVIAQPFYHNWQANLDGRSASLLRANHAFQALEVPAGRHEATIKYQDRAFYFGAGVSLVAAVACMFLWFRERKPSSR